MAKNVFEASLRLTEISLLGAGIRLNKGSNTAFQRFFDKFVYIFNMIWLHTDVLAELNYMVEAILSGKDFLEISLALPMATICLLATAKSLPLYLNNDTVIKFVDKLKSIHPEIADDANTDEANVNAKKGEFNSEDDTKFKKSHSNVENEIVTENTRFLKFIVLLQYYIFVAAVLAFPLMPVTAMGYEYWKTGAVDYKYPYLTKYFFDTSTPKVWPIIYLHHVWSTFIVGLNVFGSDTLFYAACIYIQMHFRILCHRLEKAVTKSTELTRRQLAKAIKRHQDLMELVNQAEILYSKSTLFNIITSSVQICLSGFVIMMLPDIGKVLSFATFLLMNLSQISLLCYFGDMLMRSSTEISTAVYKSNWYDSDQSIKRMVFIILIRAQRPCKLTASNFSDLNLTAFTTILSRSWSYFALLKTMYKEK